MNNPEYVEINSKKYKINTDFRIALRCNKIVVDEEINDYEKMMAIIYLLYGDEGLQDRYNYEKLLDKAFIYLSCGETKDNDNEEPDMDFEQDINLIRASFKSDYNIDLSKENMHWWDFYMYLNGLTENCVLNRVRELRTYDTSDIHDIKEKKKIEKAKKRFALKKYIKLNDTQRQNVETFYNLTGIKRKE